MFEVGVWVNGPSARLTNLEVLSLNPASVTFFWSFFFTSGPFAALFHTNLSLCHTYICQHDRAMKEWTHYIRLESWVSVYSSHACYCMYIKTPKVHGRY